MLQPLLQHITLIYEIVRAEKDQSLHDSKEKPERANAILEAQN